MGELPGAGSTRTCRAGAEGAGHGHAGHGHAGHGHAGHGHAGHGHAGHGHAGAPPQRRRLLAALVITAGALLLQVLGSWLSGSLALLADAGHVLTDLAGLTIALVAVTLGARPATPRRTFGHHRVEILAAAVNAVILLLLTSWLLIEAWQRWSSEPQVRGASMLTFAAIGLLANLVVVALLHGGARANLNIRGAYLHALGDLLGSLAVLTAAAVILLTGWQRADVLATVAVALLILPRALGLLRESVDVLLEATPRGVDLDHVRAHILGLPGVIGVHDLHAWLLTSGMPVLSAHVVVTDEVLADGGGAWILDALGDCLAEHFDVAHCTFQIEPATHAAHERSIHA